MNFLRFFLSLIPVVWIGWVVLHGITSRRSSFSLLEKGALSFGIGWGVLSFEMFYGALVGISWNVWILIGPWLLSSFFFIPRMKKSGKISLKPFSHEERRLFLILLFLIIYVTLESLTLPLTYYNFWDGWSIWGQKAKAFALKGSLDVSLFTDPSRTYAHPEYPLLLPLSECWLYLGMGEVDEQVIKLLFPLFYFSFLALFWKFFEREKGRQESLLYTVLLATSPLLIYHLISGYAELPLTFYYTFSTLSLYFWCWKGKREDLWVGVLFSAFAAWTKSEGQALLGLNAMLFGSAYLLTSKEALFKKWMKIFLLFSPFIVIAPWWIFLKRLHVSPSEFVPQFRPDLLASHGGRMPLVFGTLVLKLLNVLKWNLLWVALFLMGGIFRRELFSFPRNLLAFALILHLALYYFIYVIHPLDVLWAMNVDDSYNRVLLHAAPLALYLLGGLMGFGPVAKSRHHLT